MSAAQHHEAKIERYGGMSLPTRVLGLLKSGYPVEAIAIALFGENSELRRRQVHDLIRQAQLAEARAH